MIIGLDGYAGAGKDTVGDILVKVGFTKVSFADALREAAVASTNLDLNTFIDRDIKDRDFKDPYILTSGDLCDFCSYLDYGHKCDEVVLKYPTLEFVSPRQMLQVLGTEVGRELLSSTIWLDKYKEKIYDIEHVVTPDARFSNERQLIADLQGLNMFVSRQSVKPSENHVSGNDKWPLDKYDVIIHNDSSIQELMYGVGLWSNEWMKRR